jgi:hypothetical protein
MSKSKTTVKLADNEAFVVLDMKYWQWISDVLLAIIDVETWSDSEVQEIQGVAAEILSQATSTVRLSDEIEDQEYGS